MFPFFLDVTSTISINHNGPHRGRPAFTRRKGGLQFDSDLHHGRHWIVGFLNLLRGWGWGIVPGLANVCIYICIYIYALYVYTYLYI